MGKKIKTLTLFNALFYVNNYILIVLTNAFGLEGIVALWFLTPFILILFTTLLLEIKKERLPRSVKRLAVLDFALRCIVLIINFIVLSELILIPFVYLIGLGMIFMVLNIYIEWKMYKQLLSIPIEDELTKQEIDDVIKDYTNDKTIMVGKPPAERKEINAAFHTLTYAGYSMLLTFLLIVGSILSFSIFEEKGRLVIMVITFLLLAIYFYLTERKLQLFYMDKKCRQKISIRDNLTFLIGLSIIYILQGYIHIGTGTFNFLGFFIALLFFIPTFQTNQFIKENFNHVNKQHINRKKS